MRPAAALLKGASRAREADDVAWHVRADWEQLRSRVDRLAGCDLPHRGIRDVLQKVALLSDKRAIVFPASPRKGILAPPASSRNRNSWLACVRTLQNSFATHSPRKLPLGPGAPRATLRCPWDR